MELTIVRGVWKFETYAVCYGFLFVCLSAEPWASKT